MRSRITAGLAYLVWLLSLYVLACTLILAYLNQPAEFAINLSLVLVVFTYQTVGLVIAVRRPEHLIGWILIAFFLAGFSVFIVQYNIYKYMNDASSYPGSDFLTWVGFWIIGPVFGLVIFLLLLFPDARLPSPRWRLIAWLAVLWTGTFTIYSAFAPASYYSYPSIQNPFGIETAPGLINASRLLILPLGIIVFLPVVLSVFLRFRKAKGVIRQQLKWFFFASAILIIALIPGAFGLHIPENGPFRGVLNILAFMGLPIAIGIAILKHNLLDIDILINRSVVYGVLTGILSLIYYTSIVLIQQIFKAESEITTVLATLAIAALFIPLRRRIQNTIDRRFYRRKYDAEKTIAAFSAFLQEEVDLDQLETKLLSIIDDAFQSEHVFLWLPER